MNLRLLQLGDSALPIGGYSQSWGLEAAVEGRNVYDATSLERWTRLWLRLSVGPCEGVVVAAVCRAVAVGDWTTVRHANELLWAGLLPPTVRHGSRDLGEQLLALAAAWPWAKSCVAAARDCGEMLAPPSQWHHAPVFAILAAGAGSLPEEALALYLHQAATGVIGAGVRAIPVGHTHGQQVLARLHGEIESLARAFAGRDLETAGSYCPAYEVWCHAQSRLYTRLFRS